MKIICKNDGLAHEVQCGITLGELSRDLCPEVTDSRTGRTLPAIAALVDHKLKGLEYRVEHCHEIEFIGYDHPDGQRTYLRSLCFLLQRAVAGLFPDKVLMIEHALPTGLFCRIAEAGRDEDGRVVAYIPSAGEVDAIRDRMRGLVDRDLPFGKEKMLSEEAQKIFERQGQSAKATLFRSVGKYFNSVYTLDGRTDTFYGPLVLSTGCLRVFDLISFSDGFCLQYPSDKDFEKVVPVRPQEKISSALSEYAEWCQITGIRGIGTLNQRILEGQAISIINMAEAMHERKYAEIADTIYAGRHDIKIVFIAGPSSSGKTSSSLRIAQQCRVLGLDPKVIELDNYFVEREKTPKDKYGEYDFEALGAMDLDLLSTQLNGLLAGETVEIPRYDFKLGKKVFEGRTLHLREKDVLIMEGIHALNPAMVSSVDPKRILRVYVSALTSLGIDENNNISTSDNRLLRRMIRDNRVRGIDPESTLMRWGSVRRGERNNIFPFQEYADVLFNSALIYELPMLKYYAEPLLRRIAPTSPAYTEAVRLLKFLGYITALQPSEIAAIPPTAIMREFIGGQTLL